MRRRTDRLYLRSLGPREREALVIIEACEGITIAELAETLGVGMSRVWVIVSHLELNGVRRSGAARPSAVPATGSARELWRSPGRAALQARRGCDDGVMARPRTPEEIEAEAADCQEMADGLNELADRMDPERKIEAAPDILRIDQLDPLDPARLRCQANVYERLANEFREMAPMLRDALARLRGSAAVPTRSLISNRPRRWLVG